MREKGLVEFDHGLLLLLMGGDVSGCKDENAALVGDGDDVLSVSCPNAPEPALKGRPVHMPLPETGLSWNRKLGAPAKNGELAITSIAADDAKPCDWASADGLLEAMLDALGLNRRYCMPRKVVRCRGGIE